jgi:hypothetical protein
MAKVDMRSALTQHWANSVCSLDARARTLTPKGAGVRDLISRSPSRKSWPYRCVSESGCTTPKPPASETAATSSGFDPGYIGPLMMGMRAPVSASSCRVALESGALELDESDLVALQSPQRDILDEGCQREVSTKVIRSSRYIVYHGLLFPCGVGY